MKYTSPKTLDVTDMNHTKSKKPQQYTVRSDMNEDLIYILPFILSSFG